MTSDEIKITCRCCGKDNSQRFYMLLLTQDFSLHHNPSMFHGLSHDATKWENLYIHLSEHTFKCTCGQSIQIRYNTHYNLYLMEQTSLDETEMWQEFIYVAPDNSNAINKLTRDNINEPFKRPPVEIQTIKEDKRGE